MARKSKALCRFCEMCHAALIDRLQCSSCGHDNQGKELIRKNCHVYERPEPRSLNSRGSESIGRRHMSPQQAAHLGDYEIED